MVAATLVMCDVALASRLRLGRSGTDSVVWWHKGQRTKVGHNNKTEKAWAAHILNRMNGRLDYVKAVAVPLLSWLIVYPRDAQAFQFTNHKSQDIYRLMYWGTLTLHLSLALCFLPGS